MKLCFFGWEIKNLEEENRNLKEQLKCRKPLSYDDIKDDDKNVKMMTGLQGSAMFEWILKRIRHKIPNLTYHRSTRSKKEATKNKKRAHHTY